MEVAVKTDAVNGGAPLPQRVLKNQAGGNKGAVGVQGAGNKNNQLQNQQKPHIDAGDGAPVEKKPRFNQGAGPQGGGGGGGGGQNQGQKGGFAGNKGFANRGRGGNQNRGGNRGNFQNQNQQNQNQNQNLNQNQNQPNDIKAPVVVVVDDNNVANPPIAVNNDGNRDVGNRDGGNREGGNREGGNRDGGNRDGGNRDFGNRDGGNRDGGNRDGGNRDGGNRDGGNRGGNRGGGNHGGNQGGGNRDRSRGGNRGGQGGGGGGNMGGFGGRGDDFFIGQRLRALVGPTHEIPPIEAVAEAKFSGRNRLYIGNLTNDITENELRELFKPYGEIAEVFANAEKNFAFLKVDYHANAEKAKRELDGSQRKGRNLRVRFAPNATILRVKNLTQFVSNELLYKCFEIFGPVERANIIVDDRGKHTGEGIIEFAKKSSSNACMRLCSEKCFFLTASLRPCVVEPFEVNEDADGLPDKALNKKTQEFNHERSVGPRFAEIDTFEHEYGTRWKQLYELYKSKQEALKRELKMEEEKLEAQMEYARYEHETELLRQELRKRESDNERKKMEWEMREKQAEELKKRDEDNMRRQQTEMQSRMLRQEEEMRRRQQENTLFMQAQQLNSLLDQQEGTQVGGSFGANGGASNNFDGFGAGSNSPFDFRGNNMSGGANNAMSGNAGANNPQDQFPFEFGGNNQNQGGQGNQRGNNAAGGKGNNNNNPWERRRRF